jgi:DNA replication and repair protein RecF
MRVTRLLLTDFRNYEHAELEPAPGLTVIIGENGAGKTSLLEAVGYLATGESFRGVTPEALVRHGCAQAVVRAEAEGPERAVLLEAEIPVVGRARLLVNRQPVRRAQDRTGTVRITVFSPDDLELVKGGPATRRRYLDELLVSLHPRHAALRSDLERILRQRNALLRQAGGRLSGDVATTLDVWDARLVDVGEALAAAREELTGRLEPLVVKAHANFSRGVSEVTLAYQRSWAAEGTLGEAVAAARNEEIRRGVTLVGPQRDDLAVTIDGRPARGQASQGEQRSLALALRLAGHGVVVEGTGTSPVLLLDDVFSELDADRSDALLTQLPASQTLLTTVGPAPAGAHAEATVRIATGRVM